MFLLVEFNFGVLSSGEDFASVPLHLVVWLTPRKYLQHNSRESLPKIHQPYLRKPAHEAVSIGEECIFDIRCGSQGMDKPSTSTFKGLITLLPASFTTIQMGSIIKDRDIKRGAHKKIG